MMQLTDDQQASLRKWAEEGATLGEIQKRLEDDFDIRISYMEARFLISDLNVSIKSKEEPVKKAPPEDDALGAEPGAGNDLGDIAGGVSVTLDTIAQPGTMISGKAKFSDGEVASWYVDQMGQLGLDSTTPGYKPSPADLAAFQRELSKAAEQAGF